MTPAPFVRSAGSGPGVVCLHSNASSSGQWRASMELLAPRFRVLAVDSYGAGKSPEWPSDRVITLADEVALIEPVLQEAGSPLILVGHSYGGAVALRAALDRPPGEVRALVLYEPTLFALVDAASPPPNDADGIRGAVAASAAALERGDRHAAAQAFIDYWMEEGAFRRMPGARREPIAQSAVNVRRWAHALHREPTPLAAFGRLEMPVLLMAASARRPSARAVTHVLAATLPRVELQEFAELGHMGPVTHPEPVNAAIARFLERL